MKIFPAIDIMDGKVVRLFKGDYGTRKDYATTCASAAEEFARCGAKYIHVVDLDGAKSGKAENACAISSIIEASGAFVEVGGGIRDEAQIESYLAAGAGRVILGTVAVRDYAFVERMAAKYGERIAVGVDAADGKVAVSGWREITDVDSMTFCKRLINSGVRHVIYTDIACDGTLGGTNLSAYEKLAREIGGAAITASGGISSVDEIVTLKNLGVGAAILGKALYEKKLSLADAIAEAGEQ